MKYAEILLPLPLYSTYTYEIGDDMEDDVKIGSRVLVQFGKKKFYTGIVEMIHSRAPEGYEVKPVMGVLDSEPVVIYPQLKFWRWISEYYLCSPGDVFKAALPAGLKPESETFVSLSSDYELNDDDNHKLSEHQAFVIQLLQNKKRLKISELEAELKVKDVTHIVNTLLTEGIVEVSERVVERYKPKRVTFVDLSIDRSEMDCLHDFFDKTSRSRQQEKMLVAYLELSGWMQTNRQIKAVSRDELLSVTKCSPAILKALVDKGIFRTEKKIVNRFYSASDTKEITLAKLSPSQNKALEELRESFGNNLITLFYGVTGSGKTEVYTHLIADSLLEHKQVLYLVPEISLTTQLTDRLRKVFGDKLIIYHSKFTDTERVEVWKRMLSSNEPLVVLGVRSSVFLPFRNLGLVIVDEEHESSYKQFDPAPRYNARDAAIILSTMHGAKILLGSATPSVETYYKAKTGKYGLVSLAERYEGAVLPSVEIVDMRDQRKRKLNKGILSQPLYLATGKALKDGNQAILFQNRRGFAPVVICSQCGWTPKCHDCDVSLVYHKNSGMLRCHYCGYSRPLPKLCPACGQNSIEVFGYGTERIADEVHNEFKEHRVSRMDLDTTRNKDDYQEIIEEFATHQTDILVGTQMVSKGLDFEKVKVVGVINADTVLNFPDFRSNERAFNMLEQVAGRAGRKGERGAVFIQTSKPEEPVLKYVKAHDYIGFYNEELKERLRYNYPPYVRVINIYIKNKDAKMADEGAVILVSALKNYFGDRVLGPEKPFVSRVATWYIQSIMLKIETGASMKKVKNLLRGIFSSVSHIPQIKTSMIYYDVDPV